MSKEEQIGIVVRIMPYGAFVKLDGGGVGLIHISQFDSEFVEDVRTFINVGEKVAVRIIGKEKKGKLNLSFVRKINEKELKKETKDVFELKMKKFLKDSQSAVTDYKRRLKRKMKP